MLSHTDAEMAVVLVERHEVHGSHRVRCNVCSEPCLRDIVGSRAWALDRRDYFALWAAVGRSNGGLRGVRQRERHVYVSAVTGSLEGNRRSSDE